jgi:SAM-dependent methyltransferase
LFAVLTCIPTNKGQELLIQEIHQVIRPGGVLYVSDYWLQDDDRNRERYRKWKDRYGTYGIFELSEGAVCRHHDRKWIEKLFSSFEMIEFVDIDVFTMNGNKAKAFQYYGRKRSDL